MSNSLRPHELQHVRLPCPSPSPGVCSNSCPLSQWCHPPGGYCRLHSGPEWDFLSMRLIFSVKDQGEEPFFHEPVFGFFWTVWKFYALEIFTSVLQHLQCSYPHARLKASEVHSIIQRMNSLFPEGDWALPGTSKGNLLFLNVGVGRSQNYSRRSREILCLFGWKLASSCVTNIPRMEIAQPEPFHSLKTPSSNLTTAPLGQCRA